eukprot:SAG11_NODE_294_length_11142_cov_7.050439_7_plen_243_part_00
MSLLISELPLFDCIAQCKIFHELRHPTNQGYSAVHASHWASEAKVRDMTSLEGQLDALRLDHPEQAHWSGDYGEITYINIDGNSIAPRHAVLLKILPTWHVLWYGLSDSAALFKIQPIRPYHDTAYVILQYFSRYRPHGTYCGTAYVILLYFSRYCIYGTYCGTTYVFLRCFSRYCPTTVRPTYSYAVHMVSLLTCRSVPYVRPYLLVSIGGLIVKIEDFGPDLLVCFIAPSYFMHSFLLHC